MKNNGWSYISIESNEISAKIIKISLDTCYNYNNNYYYIITPLLVYWFCYNIFFVLYGTSLYNINYEIVLNG